MGIAEHGATGAPAIANPGQETKMDFHLFSLVPLEAGLNTNAGWRICHASLEMMEPQTLGMQEADLLLLPEKINIY